MSKRTGPTNPLLKQLIQEVKKASVKTSSPFLKDLAKKLNKPRRQRIEVNLAHINRHASGNGTVVVPGIVLGYGSLSTPLTVSAWRFSGMAREKITKSKGKAITIQELIEKNPRGVNVKILC